MGKKSTARRLERLHRDGVRKAAFEVVRRWIFWQEAGALKPGLSDAMVEAPANMLAEAMTRLSMELNWQTQSAVTGEDLEALGWGRVHIQALGTTATAWMHPEDVGRVRLGHAAEQEVEPRDADPLPRLGEVGPETVEQARTDLRLITAPYLGMANRETGAFRRLQGTSTPPPEGSGRD